MMLPSFSHNFMIIIRWFSIILEPFWHHFRIDLGSFWRRLRINFESFLLHFQIVVRSFWNKISIILSSFHDNFKIGFWYFILFIFFIFPFSRRRYTFSLRMANTTLAYAYGSSAGSPWSSRSCFSSRMAPTRGHGHTAMGIQPWAYSQMVLSTNYMCM